MNLDKNVFIGRAAHGRGIFARRALRRGTVLAVCPVIFFPKHAATKLAVADLGTGAPDNLGDYIWEWPGKHPIEALPLGFPSFMNHSDAPNVESVYEMADRAMSFHTIRVISAGEELTLDYGNGAERFKR